MPDRSFTIAWLGRAIFLAIVVATSTSSPAAGVSQFGLASCFQADNPTSLAPSNTTLLAVASDPAFETALCQIDTEIPISGFSTHLVLPEGDWLVVTHAGLYTFDPGANAAPLGIEEAVGATGAALGPSGRVAITTANHIAILDMEKGGVERLLNVAGNDSPHFLHDGTILVGRGDELIQLSAETGREIRAIYVGGRVREVSRRADGIIVVKTPTEVILYDEGFQAYARFAAVQARHPCLRPRRSGSRC